MKMCLLYVTGSKGSLFLAFLIPNIVISSLGINNVL